MLLGLNGKLNAGKDTVYQILKEVVMEMPVERVAFADKLKESAAALLDMEVEHLEFLKNRPDWAFMLHDPHGQHVGIESESNSFNMRTFLQRYGTEAHRDVFGQDFWIDAALPPDFDHEDKLVVVTDMRFPNEKARVEKLDGFCVYVDRGEMKARRADHPSEQDLTGFDWTICNHSDMENLKSEVEAMWIVLRALKRTLRKMWA